MNSFQWKTLSFIGVLGGVVLVALTSAAAQAQTIILRGDQPERKQSDQPNRISIEYVAVADSHSWLEIFALVPGIDLAALHCLDGQFLRITNWA